MQGWSARHRSSSAEQHSPLFIERSGNIGQANEFLQFMFMNDGGIVCAAQYSRSIADPTTSTSADGEDSTPFTNRPPLRSLALTRTRR
jgi:hypothetical protein